MNLLFARQVGLVNFLRRGVSLRCRRLMGVSTSVKLPFGGAYEIEPWDPSGSEVYVTRCNTDWGNEYIFAQFFKQNGAFLDIGCHTGYYSLFFSPLVSQVVGVEPSARCAPVLQDLEKLDPKFHHVQALCGACDSDDVLVHQSNSGWAATDEFWLSRRNFTTKTKLPQYTIDQLERDVCKFPVTAIKIDVDGPDFDVLLGAEETISKHRPGILIEHFGDALKDWLKDHGYKAFGYAADMQRPYSLRFEELTNAEDGQFWLKMTLCLPEERVPDLGDLGRLDRLSGGPLVGIQPEASALLK